MGPNEKTMASLRAAPGVNVLVSTERGRISPADYYRMIAAVEECNAEFEAWYLSDQTADQRAKICGYPVYYVSWVNPDEMFGGMWSDLDENGIPKHAAAFVRLRVNNE